MALDERIKIIIDVVSDKATASVKGFRQSVIDADGATGKFKAGAGAAFGAVKANAAEFAMAAGSALVAFGIKSAVAFKDLGLEVGRFGDATGIAYEDASRLVDIAGDLGVESGTIQSAIQRMNLAIEGGRLGDFADQVVLAKDGSVDAYESFINLATSIGAIEDPTERARVAQQTFGKSYGQIAELMEMDADDLRETLEKVPKTNIFDEKKVDQAREFRQVVEDLKGRLEELTLSFGEGVVPVLSDMAGTLMAIDDAIEALPFVDGIGDVMKYGQSFFELVSGIDVAKKALALFRDEAKLTEEEAEIVGTRLWADTKGGIDATAAALSGILVEALGEVETASKDAAFEVRTLDQAWADLKGEIDDQQAFMGLEESFTDLKVKGMEAWAAASDGAEDATEKTRLYEEAQLNTKEELIDYLAEVEKLPPERVTKILAAFDQGNLDFVLGQLDILSRNRTMNLSIVTRGGIGYDGDKRDGPRARGGRVRGGGANLVGENFDGSINSTTEVLLPGEDGLVASAPDVQSALRNMGYGGQGGAMVVDRSVTNIYMPAAATPDDVRNARRRYDRIQGPL